MLGLVTPPDVSSSFTISSCARRRCGLMTRAVARSHREAAPRARRLDGRAATLTGGGVPRLVTGAVFKAVVVEQLGQAGSIPVRLRQRRPKEPGSGRPPARDTAHRRGPRRAGPAVSGGAARAGPGQAGGPRDDRAEEHTSE